MSRNSHFASFVLLAAFSPVAIAASIDLKAIPSSSTLLVGHTATVDLTISGLGAGTVPSLSAFDVSLSFNPAVIAVSTVLFGSSTPPYDELNLEGLGTASGFDTPSAGLLHLYEVSLDSSSVLNSRQLAAFTLAEVTFTAETAGSAALNLAVNTLGDAYGNALFATTVSSGSLDVTNASVAPEPTSILLAGIGGVLLAMKMLILRRRKKHELNPGGGCSNYTESSTFTFELSPCTLPSFRRRPFLPITCLPAVPPSSTR